MSAQENRVNPSTTRPADFVVDGWRRGVHYTQGDVYVVSLDVTGELPRLLVQRRLAADVGREVPGVRQPFEVPELDGPLTASTTGAGFPRSLVRRPDAREALVAALGGGLRLIEVSAAVNGVTGIVVQCRSPEACLDLAGSLVRAVDDLLARKVVFADAVLARQGPEAAKEPAPVVVEGLVTRLADATSWVAGHVARVGDAVEARLTLSEAGLELAGTLRLAWRDSEAAVVDGTLDAAVPSVPWAPLHLSVQAGLVDKLRAIAESRVGDDVIDGAFITFGDARNASALATSHAVLLRLAAGKARVELSEQRLRVLVPPAARDGDALAALCNDLLEIWRRVAIARSGNPLVETPAEEGDD